MRPLKTLGLVALFFAGSLCSAAALVQQTRQNANDGSPPITAPNQTAPAPQKAAPDANGNPFPTAQSQAAAQSQSAGKSGAPTQAPQAGNAPSGNPPTQDASPQKTSPNAPSHRKGSAATDNPFPEAQSRAAAGPDSSGPAANKSAGANPGSSSGGYSSSDAHLPPPDLGEGSPNHPPKLDSFTRDQTQDGRIKDDLNVADLYMKNGNYRGAFLRYEDALKYDPQNDTALYGSADAMCRQNMTWEAMARFKSYTKSNPQGKYAIKAEKMLAHPNKCTNNW